MNKYCIEGNINFYEKLNEYMLDDDSELEDEQLCMISNTPLNEPYIKMTCGHCFNYEPLYKDLIHVKSFNHMEVLKLKANQIRCPYCRKIENHVLPYMKEYRKCIKRDSINWLDVNKHQQRNMLMYGNNKCDWHTGINEECCLEKQTILSPDGKCSYCVLHYFIMFPKQAPKRLKIIRDKKNTLVNNEQNVIISDNKCSAILKSGIRKGQSCNAKSKIGGKCLRHASNN